MATVEFTDSVAGTGYAFEEGREYEVGKTIEPEQATEFVRIGLARIVRRGPEIETAVKPEPEVAAERVSFHRGRRGRR